MKRYAWIAVTVVLVDQAVKAVASTLRLNTVLLPGVLRLTYAENTGMAFSMLSGKPWLLGFLSIGLVVTGWLVLKRYPLGRLSRTASMLILGGAVGNMIDRFVHGYVVDMFEVLLFRFAIFNVADAALVTGCTLMAIALLCCPKDWSESNGSTEEADAEPGNGAQGSSNA